MEKEEGHLPFLDIEIYRKTDGSLGHRVYRKPTHTSLYLHQNSHHQIANNQSLLPRYTETKLSVTRIPLTKNWNISPPFSRIMDTALSRYDERVLKPGTRTAKTNDQPTSTAFIPYTQTTYGRLSRMMAKHNIKSVALPPRKIYSYLSSVKNALELRTPDVYNIPCKCGNIYIGQSGRSIQIRIEEHSRHTRLAQTEKSAVAERSIN